jgi:hypothetical protein
MYNGSLGSYKESPLEEQSTSSGSVHQNALKRALTVTNPEQQEKAANNKSEILYLLISNWISSEIEATNTEIYKVIKSRARNCKMSLNEETIREEKDIEDDCCLWNYTAFLLKFNKQGSKPLRAKISRILEVKACSRRDAVLSASEVSSLRNLFSEGMALMSSEISYFSSMQLQDEAYSLQETNSVLTQFMNASTVASSLFPRLVMFYQKKIMASLSRTSSFSAASSALYTELMEKHPHVFLESINPASKEDSVEALAEKLTPLSIQEKLLKKK